MRYRPFWLVINMAVVLVIGALRGLGLEFFRQYPNAGDRVIATVRDAAARVQALGAEVLSVDVSPPSSVSGLAWPLDGEKIDTALYVAGVYASGTALLPPARALFDATLHTNVRGAMQGIPQVAPLVEAAQGRFGFVSSDPGPIGSVASSQAWIHRITARQRPARHTERLDARPQGPFFTPRRQSVGRVVISFITIRRTQACC